MSDYPRNAPCPCGSGKKYKRCCGRNAPRQDAGRQATNSMGSSFQQATLLYQQGNPQAAGTLCEQLLRQSPNDVPVLELSAGIAFELGQIKLAAGYLLRQLKLQPDNAFAHCNMGMALHMLGKDEEAYEHCRKALALQPDLAEAYDNIGNIYESHQNFPEALKNYEKALELGAQDPRIFVNAGVASQRTGDLEKAAARFRQALKQAPDFVPAHSHLGDLLQKSDQLDEAETHFRRALALSPNDPETHNNMGTLWLAKNEQEKAKDCFTQALRLDPNYPGAYINLGNLCESMDNLERSRENYEKALELDPSNPVANTNLGRQLMELGETKKAAKHFAQALLKDPNYVPALCLLGEMELLWGRGKEAKKYIDRALELAPQDAYSLRAKAALDSEWNDFKSAEAGWRHIIKLKPHSQDGYIGLADLLFKQEDYNGARTIYQEAEDTTGGSVKLYHKWSYMEERIHNIDEAERLAKKLNKLDPSHPGFHLLKAKLLRRRKDLNAALKELKQVNEKDINNKQFRSNYLFELGEVQDKLGHYKEAFDAHDEANRLKNDYVGVIYSAEADQADLQEHKALFSQDNWAQLRALSRGLEETAPTPIFIVGFPRSGTSLLEQMLGAHPQIAPAGELVFISTLVKSKCKEIIGSTKEYPECLLDPEAPLDQAKLKAMRNFYLSSITARGVADEMTCWITDKMPNNIRHLGLISLLFPDSPIIHASRHPLDTCLSAYFTDLRQVHRYTSSLESTAEHYVKIMDRLEHFKQILDMRFLEIRYQELVDNQEETLKKVLEFIGANWDDRCLQHHQSERVVKTASYEQVTQKVYRSSLCRYRNYWDAVQPIIPILESTIQHFGYSIDGP